MLQYYRYLSFLIFLTSSCFSGIHAQPWVVGGDGHASGDSTQRVENDICKSAIQLITGAGCTSGNNLYALFNGPKPGCIIKPLGGLWYRWNADFSGQALIKTRADFNDVISIFKGDCSVLQEIQCHNADEHGFAGEEVRFQAIEGTGYFIRICGTEDSFGTARGEICVSIEKSTQSWSAPVNDACTEALLLIPEMPCVTGTNRHAGTTGPLPGSNTLARADIWYSFMAPALPLGNVLEIRSNANFSDVMSLYEGNCGNLSEILTNPNGSILKLESLVPNETYLLQIAGAFASIEGDVCPELQLVHTMVPMNNDCTQATPITIGSACTSALISGATCSGLLPACVPAIYEDIWFVFEAPVSGTVRINSNTDIEHVMSLWNGECDALETVFCVENPQRCDGYVTVGSLQPGALYFIQVATSAFPIKQETGEVCIKVTDGSLSPEFQPLILEISEQCVDVDMAKLHVSIRGGVQPYEIFGSQQDDVLPSGAEYLTVVRDATGCEKAISGKVKECDGLECALAATLIINNPSCHDSNDGSVSVVVFGATAPFEYQWSNGASTQQIINLQAGTYAVTVSDALNCQQTTMALLNNPVALTVDLIDLIQPNTGEANGAIYTSISGGTGSLDIKWFRNGVLYSTGNNHVSDLAAGTYEIQVTDQNGCSQSMEFHLNGVVQNLNPEVELLYEIFPNPATDQVSISFSQYHPQLVSVALLDASGQCVLTKSSYNGSASMLTINLEKVPIGPYILQMDTDEVCIRERVVVLR